MTTINFTTSPSQLAADDMVFVNDSGTGEHGSVLIYDECSVFHDWLGDQSTAVQVDTATYTDGYAVRAYYKVPASLTGDSVSWGVGIAGDNAASTMDSDGDDDTNARAINFIVVE